MIASGNQVANPGKIQSKTIAKTMQATNGNDPVRIVRREISGAMPLITYRFSPTGGEIKPISILMVKTTANQIGSNPAVIMICSKIGAAARSRVPIANGR